MKNRFLEFFKKCDLIASLRDPLFIIIYLLLFIQTLYSLLCRNTFGNMYSLLGKSVQVLHIYIWTVS